MQGQPLAVSYGLVAAFARHGLGLSSELHQTLSPPSADAGNPSADLAPILLAAVLGVPAGLVWTSAALRGIRFPNPVLSARLAWDALAVFLAYPETTHPLAHRIATPWLRPLSVRLAAAGVVFAAAATTFLTNAGKPAAAEGRKPAAAVADRSVLSPHVHAGEKEEGRGQRGSRDDLAEAVVGESPFTPPPQPATPQPVMPNVAEYPVSGAKPAGTEVTVFVLAAFLAAVTTPLFLCQMVLLVGMAVLPTYFDYFEKSGASAPPRRDALLPPTKP